MSVSNYREISIDYFGYGEVCQCQFLEHATFARKSNWTKIKNISNSISLFGVLEVDLCEVIYKLTIDRLNEKTSNMFENFRLSYSTTIEEQYICKGENYSLCENMFETLSFSRSISALIHQFHDHRFWLIASVRLKFEKRYFLLH